MQIILDNKSMEPLQNSRILRNADLHWCSSITSQYLGTSFQHYMYFFQFLPLSSIFSTFFWKKLEEIPFFQFFPFFPEVSEPWTGHVSNSLGDQLIWWTMIHWAFRPAPFYWNRPKMRHCRPKTKSNKGGLWEVLIMSIWVKYLTLHHTLLIL